MELRLGLGARATQDHDAAYRDRADDMLARLDQALRTSSSGFEIRRGEPQTIGPTNAIRVELKLSYRGRAWSTVQLELAPAEGASGQEIERVPAITLDHYGLQGPRDVPCLALRYQIARKLHAATSGARRMASQRPLSRSHRPAAPAGPHEPRTATCGP